MSVNKKIRTTGELREFLMEMMVNVEKGKVDLDKARYVTKLAGQINESLYAEVKVAKAKAEAGHAVEMFGALKIDDS